MQATDTATDRDFARKAATAVRWAGRALWFVVASMVRILYVLITVVAAFFGAFPDRRVEVNDDNVDLGPELNHYGHQDKNLALQEYWSDSK